MSSVLVARSVSPMPFVPDAMPDTAPQQHILQLATGYMVSSALHVVVSLRLADFMASGVTRVADLARHLTVNEDALYRLLRLLASVGVFAEVAPREFGFTPSAEALRRDRLDSVYDIVNWLADPLHFRVYADAAVTIRTGVPAIEHTVGVPAFEYLARTPDEAHTFNDAMSALSAQVTPAVLDGYDFGGIDVLFDVAGGHGELLASVLERHPAMRGILFDLDRVIVGAEQRLATRGLLHRCDLVAGDFFGGVPAGGDAYVLKHIVHDWDDSRALVILRHVRAALEGVPGGRVLLLESVIAPGDATEFGKLIDYEMLMMTGGRERSEPEFAALLRKAGFQLTRIVRLDSPLCVIEAAPVR
jgi:hypothetical protein